MMGIMFWFAEATVYFISLISLKPGYQAKWWMAAISSYGGQNMSAGVLFSLEFKQLGLTWETMDYIILGYKCKTAIYWNLVVAFGTLLLGIYLE